MNANVLGPSVSRKRNSVLLFRNRDVRCGSETAAETDGVRTALTMNHSDSDIGLRAEQILAKHGDEFVKTICQILGLNSHEVSRSAVLLDLGAGSLEIHRLKLNLEQRYQIAIPDFYAVPDVHTVDAFAWAVATGLAEK